MSSTELLLVFSFVALVWFIHIRWIASGWWTPRETTTNDSVDDVERQLALTYDAIYGPSNQYVQSDSTKTWFWLLLALCLNVICIKIELLMFQDMMETANGGN